MKIKKIIIVTLLFALHFGSLLSANEIALGQVQKFSEHNPSLKQLVELSFQNTTEKHTLALSNQLIHVLDILENELNYWCFQKVHPLHYCFSKGPLKLLKGKWQSAEIDSHITALENERKIQAYYLGKLHYLLTYVQTASLSDQSPHESELKQLISECLERVSDKTNGTIDQQITQYEQLVRLLIAEHTKPNHLMRNWIPYTLSFIGILAAGGYIYIHRADLPQWLNQSKDAIKRFFSNHIVQPIKNVHDIIFKKDEQISMSQEALEKETQVLEEMVYEYLKRQHIEDDDNICKEIAKRVSEGDVSEIMKHWKKQTRNPLWNLIFGSILRNSSIQIQQLKVEVSKVIVKGNKQWKANRINFELAAILPALLLCYGTYKIAGKTLRLFNPFKTVAQKTKPIRILVRHLFQTLNHYQHTTEISYEDQGFIYYWVAKLKECKVVVPIDLQLYFEKDVAELGSSYLSPVQKLNIITRMYQTYPFLKPV